MLILSRRVGESLLFNDDIILTVLSVKGNQVRIGITAPANVKVMREELYQKMVYFAQNDKHSQRDKSTQNDETEAI